MMDTVCVYLHHFHTLLHGAQAGGESENERDEGGYGMSVVRSREKSETTTD